MRVYDTFPKASQIETPKNMGKGEKLVVDFFKNYYKNFQPQLTPEWFPNIPADELKKSQQKVDDRRQELLALGGNKELPLKMEYILRSLFHSDLFSSPLTLGTGEKVIELPVSEYDELFNGKDTVIKAGDDLYFSFDATMSGERLFEKQYHIQKNLCYLGQGKLEYFNDYEKDGANGKFLMPEFLIIMEPFYVTEMVETVSLMASQQEDARKLLLENKDVTTYEENIKKLLPRRSDYLNKLYDFTYQILDQLILSGNDNLAVIEGNIGSINENFSLYISNIMKKFKISRSDLGNITKEELITNLTSGAEQISKVRDWMVAQREKMAEQQKKINAITGQRRIIPSNKKASK